MFVKCRDTTGGSNANVDPSAFSYLPIDPTIRQKILSGEVIPVYIVPAKQNPQDSEHPLETIKTTEMNGRYKTMMIEFTGTVAAAAPANTWNEVNYSGNLNTINAEGDLLGYHLYATGTTDAKIQSCQPGFALDDNDPATNYQPYRWSFSGLLAHTEGIADIITGAPQVWNHWLSKYDTTAHQYAMNCVFPQGGRHFRKQAKFAVRNTVVNDANVINLYLEVWIRIPDAAFDVEYTHT